MTLPYKTRHIITLCGKVELDKLHKDKIYMSTSIYVINVDGYIGESTIGEIEFARGHDIPICFHEWPIPALIKKSL